MPHSVTHLAHTPFSPRKVGMPDGADRPEPVTKTIGSPRRIILASSSSDEVLSSTTAGTEGAGAGARAFLGLALLHVCGLWHFGLRQASQVIGAGAGAGCSGAIMVAAFVSGAVNVAAFASATADVAADAFD